VRQRPTYLLPYHQSTNQPSHPHPSTFLINPMTLPSLLTMLFDPQPSPSPPFPLEEQPVRDRPPRRAQSDSTNERTAAKQCARRCQWMDGSPGQRMHARRRRVRRGSGVGKVVSGCVRAVWGKKAGVCGGGGCGRWLDSRELGPCGGRVGG
jgi:hypothetical protein